MQQVIAAALVIAALVPTSRQASAAEDAVGWADVVEHALPAVVNITVQKIVSDNAGRGRRETFFGSGFVIDPAGAIVTNKHVIDGAFGITVTFADRSIVPAQLLAAAGLTDLAVLKVDLGHPLPFLKFADSDRLRVGESVLAIGNPLGLGMSVSTGIVSALNRDIMDSPFDENIQTDASINHGNSGGPLLDRAGEVVGVRSLPPRRMAARSGSAMRFPLARPTSSSTGFFNRTPDHPAGSAFTCRMSHPISPRFLACRNRAASS
jgi:serine protease Do